MKEIARIIIVATATFSTFYCGAQNMNQPYSVYGIGDIDRNVYNRYSGMGGATLSLKSSAYTVDDNPASTIGLDRSFLVVNIATAARFSGYHGSPINAENSTNQDFWIKRIGVGIKVNARWASNIGISPLSSVNYKYTGSKAVEGSSQVYTTLYQGDGGLNNFYWNNSFAITPHIAVGVKTTFITGSINQTETLYDPGLQTTISSLQQDYVRKFRFEYGVLYNSALSKKWDLAMGARYAGKSDINADRSLTVTQDGSVIVNDRFIKYQRFGLPASYGAGVSFVRDKKTTFALDYNYEQWDNLKIAGQEWRYGNSQRIAGGVEFSRLVNFRNRSSDRRFYQVGGFYDNAPLQVAGKTVNGYGITAGMGGRMGKTLLYSLSAEGGVRGTRQANLIRENYFQLVFTVSYRDFLFSRGRKYD